MGAFTDVISTEDELRALYRQPSKLVQAKKVPRLDEVTRSFIASSPFCLIATADSNGRCDVSPKGGPPGFVKVLDGGGGVPDRVAIPDLNGNNLIDSLRNIVTNRQAGLLVLIPGKDETLRIDGPAAVTTDPAVLGLWDDELRRPKAAIGIEVDNAFIHCAKSFRRGRVWDPASWTELAGAPDGCDLIVSHLGLEQSPAELRASFEQGYEKGLAEDLPA
jgi:PPOX class probable FMN-dependent enzyme